MTPDERAALEELPDVQRAIFRRLNAYHRGPGNAISAEELGAQFHHSARWIRDQIHDIRLFVADDDCPIKELILSNPEQAFFIAERDQEADESIGKLGKHIASSTETLNALKATRLKKFGPPPPPRLFEEVG